jgi:hypothetical protein
VNKSILAACVKAIAHWQSELTCARNPLRKDGLADDWERTIEKQGLVEDMPQEWWNLEFRRIPHLFHEEVSLWFQRQAPNPTGLRDNEMLLGPP